MPVTVVVGAQWGDEGKAKVIDLLAGEHTHVVRYQGGHNAGHTVVVGTERYALQLVPSGVLYPLVIPVIGNGVVIDMPTLFNEIDTLEARGVSCAKLKVSSQAHLIFPWHQALDALYEEVQSPVSLPSNCIVSGFPLADSRFRHLAQSPDRAEFPRLVHDPYDKVRVGHERDGGVNSSRYERAG
jgi:hypothetical protein